MDSSGYLSIWEQRPDALLCMDRIGDLGVPIFVSPLVVAETHRRLLFDHGRPAATSFLTRLPDQGHTILRPTATDERVALDLIERYADLDLTQCDAVTFALMKKLGAIRAFTLDQRHFLAAGFITVPPFDL